MGSGTTERPHAETRDRQLQQATTLHGFTFVLVRRSRFGTESIQLGHRSVQRDQESVRIEKAVEAAYRIGMRQAFPAFPSGNP
ncbi:hypothetical protein GCM10027612_76670 [Microbispora bryophytorum subsp. camponoti]